jgi:WD40 repeat protein
MNFSVPQRPWEWSSSLGEPVAQVSWSPDGSFLAVGLLDGRVVLLNALDGSRTAEWRAHEDGLFRAAFSPTAPVLATSGQDGLVRGWSAGGENRFEISGGAAWAEQVAWSPNGAVLAAAAGRRLFLWDALTGTVRETAVHRSTIAGLSWKSDGSILAAACYAGVELWSAADAMPAGSLPWKTSLISLAWSPDGRWVVAGTQEQSIQIWELPFQPGNELAMSGYAAKVRELAWHSSGRYLATGGGTEVMVWDCGGQGPAGTTPRILQGHDGRIAALAYQRQGHLLASGALDGQVRLWNAGKSSQALRQFQLESPVTDLAWSPSGQRVAAGTKHGTVALGAIPA